MCGSDSAKRRATPWERILAGVSDLRKHKSYSLNHSIWINAPTYRSNTELLAGSKENSIRSYSKSEKTMTASIITWSPCGRRPVRKESFMKKTRKTKRPVSAEKIATLADRGENVSSFFTNKGRMVKPIQRVNVDFTQEMLTELDEIARQLNISRQAAIKTLVRQGLDRRYMAKQAREATS